MQKHQAQKKQIVIQKRIPTDLHVFGDLNMVTTIIRNLVSNAIKYTFEGGSITISVTPLQDATKISVQDTGIGIKLRDLNKIFKIETNFSTNGTDNESGTGLGLILCNEFTEKHQGKIWLESEFGRGSTFHFTLPHQSKKT